MNGLAHLFKRDVEERRVEEDALEFVRERLGLLEVIVVEPWQIFEPFIDIAACYLQTMGVKEGLGKRRGAY